MYDLIAVFHEKLIQPVKGFVVNHLFFIYFIHIQWYVCLKCICLKETLLSLKKNYINSSETASVL